MHGQLKCIKKPGEPGEKLNNMNPEKFKQLLKEFAPKQKINEVEMSRKDRDDLEAMMQKYSDYLNSSKTKSDFSEYANLLKNHTKKVDEVLFDIKHGWM
jgi:stage III sporulation protein SpoIIIAA